MKIQPINNYVLVRTSKGEEKTSSGIIIPDTAREKPNEGEVVALSAAAKEQISIGDIVIYKEYSGTKFSQEGENFLFIQESEILGKYETVDEI
ncbi:MAG: co-chaperone GroES [Candidatus Marinimicrobia bacterium]|nr:co-chaperone GroES [Candidatus Neomarinimicrobiota bacterium]